MCSGLDMLGLKWLCRGRNKQRKKASQQELTYNYVLPTYTVSNVLYHSQLEASSYCLYSSPFIKTTFLLMLGLHFNRLKYHV